VGQAMCMGVLLMAGLAVAQPPAGSPAGSAGAATRVMAAVESGQPASGGQGGTTVAMPVVQGQAQEQGPQATLPPAASPVVPPAISAGVRVAEPLPPARSRYLVQVMEGVLQSAVRYAAAQMNTKLQAVTPDLLQLSGAARARGFRLDGYGVFFDVEVPAALRQTMGWTARLMQQNDQTLEQAFLQLRRMATELEGKRRLDAETALKLVELRARPFLPRPYAPTHAGMSVKATSTPGGAAVTSASATSDGTPIAPGGHASDGAGRPAEDHAWMQNPDGAYETEVREALISAMLNYGSTLALQPDEFLTIAARDNQSVVVPGDLSETVTVILRIRGRDLTDLMAGRVTEQDARRRVEVREF